MTTTHHRRCNSSNITVFLHPSSNSTVLRRCRRLPVSSASLSVRRAAAAPACWTRSCPTTSRSRLPSEAAVACLTLPLLPLSIITTTTSLTTLSPLLLSAVCCLQRRRTRTNSRNTLRAPLRISDFPPASASTASATTIHQRTVREAATPRFLPRAVAAPHCLLPPCSTVSLRNSIRATVAGPFLRTGPLPSTTAAVRLPLLSNSTVDPRPLPKISACQCLTVLRLPPRHSMDSRSRVRRRHPPTTASRSRLSRSPVRSAGGA